jgi:hypothetical protein
LKRIRRLDGRIFDKDELIFREKPYGNRLVHRLLGDIKKPLGKHVSLQSGKTLKRRRVSCEAGETEGFLIVFASLRFQRKMGL